MKKLLGIVVLGLFLNGCTSLTWEEINYAVDHRDTRINIFNTDKDTLKTIYVGVGSDSDERWKNKYYTKSIVQPKAQHNAPKEVIAEQQCVKNFGVEKPVFIEMLEFSKEKIKEYRLSFKKYAKYSCEISERQLKEVKIFEENTSSFEKNDIKTKENKETKTAKVSNNTLSRTFNCSYASGSSKIKIRGGTATEITSAGVEIKYNYVELTSKGAFSLEESTVPGRVFFIGAQSLLGLGGAEFYNAVCK
tara:strand:- start:133 stop:876 length:744 start_codon:yes stop_codon:yes gene_type:complete